MHSHVGRLNIEAFSGDAVDKTKVMYWTTEAFPEYLIEMLQRHFNILTRVFHVLYPLQLNALLSNGSWGLDEQTDLKSAPLFLGMLEALASNSSGVSLWMSARLGRAGKIHSLPFQRRGRWLIRCAMAAEWWPAR